MKDQAKKIAGLMAGAAPVIQDNREEMERAILSTFARDGLTAPELLTGIRGVRWSRTDFAQIADAMTDGFGKGQPLDALIIKNKIGEGAGPAADRILDGSGAKDPLIALEYLKKIEGDDRLSGLKELADDFSNQVEGIAPEGVDAGLAGLQKALAESIEKKNLVKTTPTEAEDAGRILDKIKERSRSGRAWLGLDSGFKGLNEILNGLTEGVFVLAGAPSTGKTSLAKQIADQVAEKEGVPVLFWSFEQSKDELRIKSLSRLSELDSRAIAAGNVREWPKLEEGLRQYRDGPGKTLTIIEAGRDSTLDHVRAVSMMAKHKAGGGSVFLVIDYLQIIPTGEGDSLREKIDANLSELRRLSRDLKSPILVISSMNRASYQGSSDANKKPTMSSMKESGGIEYTADAVIALWRNVEESDKLTKDQNRLTVRVEALVLKNRNGALACLPFNFFPAYSLFMPQGVEDLTYKAALG